MTDSRTKRAPEVIDDSQVPDYICVISLTQEREETLDYSTALAITES